MRVVRPPTASRGDGAGPRVPRTMSRRALLASAAAGVALGGCVRPSRLLATFGVPTTLKLLVVGVPAAQAADLVAALGACQDAYATAERGLVHLRVTTSLVPNPAWYACSPPPIRPPQTCADRSPVSTVNLPDNALGLLGAAATGQIGSGGMPELLARGRTRYEVKFGDRRLLTPVVQAAWPEWPDIVVGFDLWQCWLAPLAADLAQQWKTTTEDRQGLPGDFERHARFFADRVGTFVAAFPLLRNPMVLENLDPVTPWTWDQVIATLRKPPSGRAGFTWDTTPFRQSLLYPQTTEWAAAMVAGSGGKLATIGAGVPMANFLSPAAEAGLNSVAGVIAAGPPPADPSSSYPVAPKYMFTVMGGVRWWRYATGGLPWPAGPVRTAVPCTYLCATVVSLGKQVQQARDFASFLMHPTAQAELARWQGGLPLRLDQARVQAGQRFPHMPADLVEQLASGANDLTASDLYGGDKTVANAEAYDAVADRFAAAFAALPSAGTDPGQIAAVVRQATSG